MDCVEAHFHEKWGTLGGEPGRCVVAVSGGSDSVALLRLALTVADADSIKIAHFDHRWRAESAEDARFVEALAAKLHVSCTVGMADDDGHPSDEASARTARYSYLRTVAEQCGARYLLVGHTADDQAETVLHRILRGTGLRGLAGMRPFRTFGPAVTIFRPLLSFRRSELEDYLRRIQQPYRTDPANDDVSYTRVRIRRDLLPMLARDYNRQIDSALLRLSHTATAAQEEVERWANDQLTQCAARVEPGYACIPIAAWHTSSDFLVREMLALVWRRAGWPEQGMGHVEWQQLASMVRQGNSGQHVFPGEIVATRTTHTLVLTH